MIPYCFHTHTKRCGHAIGEDEEYVIEAIAAGVRRLGFSDHVMIPGFSQPRIRGEFSEVEGYLNSINFLKQKYQDKIKLYAGFEAEYSDSFESYYRSLFEENKIDYLILGQHFSFVNGKIEDYFGHVHDKTSMYKYRDYAVKAMSTGLFSVFAHPDLFLSNAPRFDATAKAVAIDICKAALQYDVALEINLAGIRKGIVKIGNEKRYLYPYRPFWKVVAKYKCRVVIGVDAHDPRDFKSNEYSMALQMIRELGLNHDQQLKLKEYKK